MCLLIKKIHTTPDAPPDAPALYQKIKHLPYSIMLNSALVAEGWARYSFMAAEPFLMFRSTGGVIELSYPAGARGKRWVRKTVRGNPLDLLGRLLSKYSLPLLEKPFPFIGGAAGYFAYDLARLLEKLPDKALNDLNLPDCWLGFYDTVFAVDHKTGDVYLTSTGFPEKDGEAILRAQKRLRYFEKLLYGADLSSGQSRLKNPLEPVLNDPHCKPGKLGALADREEFYSLVGETNISFLKSNFTRTGYCAAVERAKEYIAAGDIYQVNLSQRFTVSAEYNPWEVYLKLIKISPAPMAAFLNFGNLVVVSASPERFLKVFGRSVETRPIKGTRPRGKDAAEDRRLRDELWHSEKERAELVMIVDLMRNDLGRVCRVGSVAVPELFRIEEYATVFHLVSTVTGELDAGKTPVDLLAAAFPGGSVTGAPKIRAMEIIEELEPVRRGIYCGSIGYLGFDGDADLNMAIRTLVFTGGKIFFHVGGGITIDSDPEAEYTETLDKAYALLGALDLIPKT